MFLLLMQDAAWIKARQPELHLNNGDQMQFFIPFSLHSFT
ncbi:hypothetical protein CFter6_5387 [Collimonas fungivorans]|uniref:Uncharacterized protein n=1 Tax=Collimonas fungivorans TaxID=158899 RepID=A0A127PK02_9BURK|nr:hypothetical protein CFter6_5387 [Collimonas fungivorans]